MIDRHLISLAIALQHIDEDVPQLQAWGGPQHWHSPPADDCSLAAQVLGLSKLDN